MRIIALIIMILALSGCTSHGIKPAESQTAPSQSETVAVEESTTAEEESTKMVSTEEDSTEMANTMHLLIGETEVPVTWEDNASVDSLRELRPLTIQLSMYGGFEQVGSIGQSIVRDDKQTTTNYGDIVLYSGNQIVVFYGSNSWAYTKLGHIDLSQQEMSDLLGGGDVSITLQ
jgi:hypothetical protein